MSKIIGSNGLPVRPFKEIKPDNSVMVQKKYLRDKKTGDLYEVGEVDLVAECQSYRKNALDYILDRFLDDGTLPTSFGSVCANFTDKLDVVDEVYTIREQLITEGGLSPDVTIDQMRDYLKNKIQDSIKENQKGDNDENKEKKSNESQSESSNV